jgi:hypothetical protein
MTTYEAWKLKFAYAQQPTVIDVACEVTVGDESDIGIEPPIYCGRPLQTCEHDNPCGSLGDYNNHIR